MKEVRLTQGKVALVDDEDFKELNSHNWYTQKCGGGSNTYACRWIRPQAKGRQVRIFMHRQILDIADGIEIDHIDGDGLNNQKENIRECSHQGNSFNRRKIKKTSSVFKGVWREDKKWRAAIRHNDKLIHIGRFVLEADAANAYNLAAIEHFGEFARLNEI